jgi:hypothetical protein
LSSAKAVRGKHFRAYQAGTNVVLLDPDLANAFPDSASVNHYELERPGGCRLLHI